MSYRERFVDSGGIRLHVVEEGPEDGDPVLFLHGFPEFWWSWRHQMRACADAGYRAVAMDLRGFGQSDKPEAVSDYSLLFTAADVTAVIATLGGKVKLVSHDWGGALGWVYTALAGDSIERLCVMNAPHPGAYTDLADAMPQLQASWYMFFFQFEGVAEQVLSRDGLRILRAWFYDTATVKLGEDDIARLLEEMGKPGHLTAGLNWYRANVPPESYLSSERPELPSIACPSMLIWGLDDPYLTFELGRRAGEFVTGPFALHALADTGHWVQQERPDEVNELLLTFLGTDFGS